MLPDFLDDVEGIRSTPALSDDGDPPGAPRCDRIESPVDFEGPFCDMWLRDGDFGMDVCG
jgi:hypothetical protein